MENFKYDVFISHASKDKKKYVDKLVENLKSRNISLFYDADSIAWGDSITEKIDEGLANCKLAVVVISKNYFGRNWTEYELKKLLTRQNSEGKKIIRPILYGVSKKEFVKHYPSLEDIKFIYAKSFKIPIIGNKLEEELNSQQTKLSK